MDTLTPVRAVLTPEEVAAFHRDGFVIRRGLFSQDEIGPLMEACRADPDVDGSVVGIADSQGNMQEVVTWTDLTEGEFLCDIIRLERMVDATEQLLEQPIYHWHSKLSMKRPGALGRWDWHQDYAYWYHEGCLYPDMLTVTVALDKCDESNGCLRLIEGSHKFGRIEHGKVGQAVGVDQERLALIERRHKVVSCEMEPGDVVFFHANTLHASGPNVSDRPRTLLHLSYNTVANSPFIADGAGQDHHKYHGPLVKLPDDHLARRAYKTMITGQLFWSTGGGAGRAKGYGYTLLKPAKKAVAVG